MQQRLKALIFKKVETTGSNNDVRARYYPTSWMDNCLFKVVNDPKNAMHYSGSAQFNIRTSNYEHFNNAEKALKDMFENLNWSTSLIEQKKKPRLSHSGSSVSLDKEFWAEQVGYHMEVQAWEKALSSTGEIAKHMNADNIDPDFGTIVMGVNQFVHNRGFGQPRMAGVLESASDAEQPSPYDKITLNIDESNIAPETKFESRTYRVDAIPVHSLNYLLQEMKNWELANATTDLK